MQVDVFNHAESRRSNPCFTVCMSDSIDKHLNAPSMTTDCGVLTSARLSRMLRVPERDIGHWRAGIMVPGSLCLEK